MNIKRKLMTMSLTGVVGLGLTVGGATFALFSSTATNSNNDFTAGTLHISSTRDDVPTVGPMFYTDNTANSPGIHATGVWAPGDKHTRGLFLKNDGTLPAKLKNISIAYGTGSNPTMNLKFAQQANVIVWQVKWFNSVGLNGNISNLNATQMDKIMETINKGYMAWTAKNPGADPTQDPNAKRQILESENTFLMQYLSNILAVPGATINDGIVKVTDLYSANLSDLLTNADVSSFGITTDPGKAQLLAFTVELPLNTDNTYQGISANFNFGTYWEQVRNN
jgi:spore coat-associated protein N